MGRRPSANPFSPPLSLWPLAYVAPLASAFSTCSCASWSTRIAWDNSASPNDDTKCVSSPSRYDRWTLKLDFAEYAIHRANGTSQSVTLESPSTIGLPTAAAEDVLIGLLHLAQLESFGRRKTLADGEEGPQSGRHSLPDARGNCRLPRRRATHSYHATPSQRGNAAESQGARPAPGREDDDALTRTSESATRRRPCASFLASILSAFRPPVRGSRCQHLTETAISKSTKPLILSGVPSLIVTPWHRVTKWRQRESNPKPPRAAAPYRNWWITS